MQKVLTEGWKALLAAGIASMGVSASLAAVKPTPDTNVLTPLLFGFGVALTLLAIYGIVALIFPSIAPRPQMLQDALYWTAARYRNFAEKNEAVPRGDALALRFIKRHPLAWQTRLAMRVYGILGDSAGINWSLLALPPNSADLILNIANHLERLAINIPPNVRV